MKNRQLLYIVLALSWLPLVSCTDETTAPNTASTSAGPDLTVASNTWLTRRDMPLDLLDLVAVDAPNAQGQSILYTIGGCKADLCRPYHNPVPVGEVRAYNVATNTWTVKTDMPVARYGMNGAGVINGKIYVPGGFASQYKPSAALFVYNPASNTWARKRDMPAPGGGGVTGVIAGKLYVVTFSPGLGVNFFRYNPATDSWTKLPSPTNYSNGDPGGGVINGKLYLVGPRVLEYNPVTKQWTEKGSWGSELSGRTVVMLSHLYVFGFEKYYSGTEGVYIYDPVSDTWEEKPLLTRFNGWAYRIAVARVFLNGQPRVEVVGGLRDWPAGGRGTNQQYIP